MKHANKLSNAFTTMPVQDNFQRIVFPSNGLTKLEHFTIELMKVYVPIFHQLNKSSSTICMQLKGKEYKNSFEFSIDAAQLLLELIESKQNELKDEKDSVLPIIQ